MPLRYPPTHKALCPPPSLLFLHHRHSPHSSPFQNQHSLSRQFHASRPRRNHEDGKNHYETLGVHPEASHAEIKKSFYTLSKAHHPDHHPHDPHAPRRFMRISEAYSVLGHADKKAAYDRDVMRRGHHHHHGHHHGHRGSYHSTSGPAGARPASGLSRRRGTFTGPPPSFYRSGGWGSKGAKRRAAHEDSTGGSGSAGAGTGAANNMGGMGPGQDPFGHREDVPHFDKEAHERTHRRADERRARRMAGMDSEIQPEAGMTGSFLAICGVLLTSVLVPFTLLGGWRSTKADVDDKKRLIKR